MAPPPGNGPGAGGPGGFGRGRPSPDGRHDDLDPRELQKLDITIPDDASALDPDLELWLAEAATEPASPPPPEPPTGPGDHIDFAGQPGARDPWAARRGARGRRLAVTAGVVLVSMVVVALSGVVGAWIVGPRTGQTPAALATQAPDDGQVGGLMPADAVLQNGESTVAAQSIRPAVMVVVPPECADCEQLLESLSPQAGSFGVPLVAVGGPAQADQLAALTDAVGSARLVSLTDPDQVLASAYGPDTATVVVVGSDGLVTDVIHDPVPTVPIGPDLVDIVPGA